MGIYNKIIWTVSTRTARGSGLYEVAVVRTDNMAGLSSFGMAGKEKIILSSGNKLPDPDLMEILKRAAAEYKNLLNGPEELAGESCT